MKSNPTRQAVSIAAIRRERRRRRQCLECGAPAARKKILGTGRVKILTRCPAHLAALAARRAE